MGKYFGTDGFRGEANVDLNYDHAVKIGNNVKVQNGVSVYNGVTVEDDVFIGPNAAFTNDYYPRACNPDWEVSETRVEKGASIKRSIIMADCVIKSPPPPASPTSPAPTILTAAS